MNPSKFSRKPLRNILLLCCALIVTTAMAKSPNIVLIFTDDQGYQDIGCFGAPKIRTPHLDNMALEGMRFTDFYSANSVCSPSRAALLTGCYPTRVNIPGVLFPRHEIGLNPSEITMADMLMQANYATACVGKWHLGHHPEFLPTSQGFDRYYGIPYSNDMTIDPSMQLANNVVLREGMTAEKIKTDKPKKNWVPLLRNEEVVEYPCDQSTLTQRYTQEAVNFIEENQKKPFFLYMPHTLPHIPLAASPEFKGSSLGGFYGDTIEEIDWSVGEILSTLKRLKIDNNTLVIFTTDNGPWNLKNGHGGSALPLRGYKFQTYEGGMRVPCIMRWPGKIPAASECHEIASTIDLLPTFARITGATVPSDRVIDGMDIFPLMLGRANARSPHQSFYYYRGRKLEAMRQGSWKIRFNKEIELYHLGRDLSETKNLAAKHPQRVKSMLREMKVFDESLRANSRPEGRL
ncbi:sulfatase [Verrucomicrobia bacterium]|nr:sulfatase [Verrucomicrobiota bacterium]